VLLPCCFRCIEDRGQRWVYTACFFDNATQSEPWGANKVSLGRWKGFNQDYTQVGAAAGAVCVDNTCVESMA
jgi:hypothetical protein